MRKLTLVLAIFFAFNFLWSIFFDSSTTDRFLWMELNVWIVRLIWAIFASVLFYGYFKKNKN